MEEEGRFLRIPDEVEANNAQAVAGRVHEARILQEHGDAMLIDDDEKVFVTQQHWLFARDLEPEMIIFCPHCETNINKFGGRHSLWVPSEGMGAQSARVIGRPTGEKVIWCFNCEILTVVLECSDQYGFIAEQDEMIDLGQRNYLNSEQVVDVDYGALGKKLVIVDAPMGRGKTVSIKKYIDTLPKTHRILSISFRISLSRYLAQQLDLKCYQDNNFWNEMDYSRCVVCLDSLWKVLRDDTPYDLVVIDECTFVQYHFVSGTIKDYLVQCVEAFKYFINTAGRVVIMQHRIPESTISFYQNILGVEKESVLRRKLTIPTTVYPIRLHDKALTLITQVLDDYVRDFNVVDGQSNMPCVVFSSRADFAGLLTYLLRVKAKELFGEVAEKRIKGIWATVQDDEWIGKFLKDPSTHSIDCDVLVTTSVMQAGHSLDRHFVRSYDFLWLGVLSFREELQLVSRLRYLGRNDMAEWKYGWVEKGRPNWKIANLKRLQSSVQLSFDNGNDDITEFLKQVYCPMRSEMSDSCNRHDHLHRTEYRMANVEMMHVETPEFTQVNPDWVVTQTEIYKKNEQESIKRYFLRLDENYDETLANILNANNLANMADLMVHHLDKGSHNFNSHVRYRPPMEGKVALAKMLNSKSLVSISGLNGQLSSLYSLGMLFDLEMYHREINPNHWLTRTDMARTYVRRLQMLRACEMYRLFAHHIGAFTSDPARPLFAEQFKAEHDLVERGSLYEFLVQHKTGFQFLRDMTPEKWRALSNQDKSKTTTNSEFSRLSNKFGLASGFRKDRNSGWIELEKSLCLLRCIMKPERFEEYRVLIGEVLWAKMKIVWDKVIDPEQKWEDILNELDRPRVRKRKQ